ncbi:MAG: hypothetical protein HY833_00315 [Candidatus Aenigmarchaeota archaeon]|nr:hypothetical protein [Candidatus Aenigmarchaeota archaeon]
MSPQETINSRDFIQEQMDQTTQDLFNARSVREIQFLQEKLKYLKQRMKVVKGTSKIVKAAKSKKK